MLLECTWRLSSLVWEYSGVCNYRSTALAIEPGSLVLLCRAVRGEAGKARAGPTEGGCRQGAAVGADAEEQEVHWAAAHGPDRRRRHREHLPRRNPVQGAAAPPTQHIHSLLCSTFSGGLPFGTIYLQRPRSPSSTLNWRGMIGTLFGRIASLGVHELFQLRSQVHSAGRHFGMRQPSLTHPMQLECPSLDDVEKSIQFLGSRTGWTSRGIIMSVLRAGSDVSIFPPLEQRQ